MSGSFQSFLQEKEGGQARASKGPQTRHYCDDKDCPRSSNVLDLERKVKQPYFLRGCAKSSLVLLSFGMKETAAPIKTWPHFCIVAWTNSEMGGGQIVWDTLFKGGDNGDIPPPILLLQQGRNLLVLR